MVVSYKYMNDPIKKLKSVQFRVSDREDEMLNELCNKFGSSPSEYMRGLLRNAHKSAFPAYRPGSSKIAKPLNSDDELSNEQLCEKYGGKVVDSPSGKSCRFPTFGDSGQMVPLTARKDFKNFTKK